ncbi:hypothetical protein [Buttiauxella gaviniae]|uniref:hypothetical protein n=1 Tax=Buttiauxella gaviniae TaxID=82990 RepID=UPI003C751530
MRERGMIFNAEMVRAILNGSKTQTRRVFKKQPDEDGVSCQEGSWFDSSETRHDNPFGKVGDRIWVRETYRVMGCATDVARLMYKASERNSFTESTRTVPVGTCTKQPSQNWTPSIHMPRWASRILLEITNVRVERLNAISEEDAKAEGVTPAGTLLPEHPGTYLTPNGDFATAEVAFQRLWESIYGEEGWQSNPWVWVIEFKRVEVGNEQ